MYRCSPRRSLHRSSARVSRSLSHPHLQGPAMSASSASIHRLLTPYHYPLVIAMISLGSLVSAGCTRAYVNAEVERPERFHELMTSGSSGGPQERAEVSTHDLWWRSLSDPQLNALVEGIFSSNLQLKQSIERVKQMRAIAVQAGSQRWPTLSLDLGWSRTKQLNPFSRLSSGGTNPAGGAAAGMAPTSALPDSFTQDNFRASMAVSYEVDVWGRIGSLTEAAELDATASEADLKTMAITLSANLVDLYLQWIEAQYRLKILGDQARDDEAMLRVVTQRFQQGLSPQIEVLQQAQQRDRTSAQLPPLNAQISTLKRRIAALRGEYNLQNLQLPKRFPPLSELPKIELPAEVLARRPDIQAARARLSAADARVSAAVSARLPGLRLNASGGYQSFELEELFDDMIWSLAGNIITPLFQGGRLKAEQARAESTLRERLLTLRERYLVAYHEIEDALALERSAREQVTRTQAQRDSAIALFESAQRRYLQGVGDFLTTLNARQGLYVSQLAMVSAERSALSARVQLHRALGGGWTERLLKAPPEDHPQEQPDGSKETHDSADGSAGP